MRYGHHIPIYIRGHITVFVYREAVEHVEKTRVFGNTNMKRPI